MNRITKLINKLNTEKKLTHTEFCDIITSITNQGMESDEFKYLTNLSGSITKDVFGGKIYLRGLIEFSNYCKNNCYYCGIRRDVNTTRYRLTKDEIIQSAQNGYDIGCRTFVLQSGEDMHYTDDIMVDIISSLKSTFPDCAVTISVGEKSHETYQRYYHAGADRYLLRHETATAEHYAVLHPKDMELKTRMDCLTSLQEIGYQVGAGLMVGSPNQSAQHLASDLVFLGEFKPQMVGIGPFLPHHDTPFKNYSSGSLIQTLVMVSLVRIMLPNALIPATTALTTLSPLGRDMGFLAGANVVMINVSPNEDKKNYLLYDNKACLTENALDVKNALDIKLTELGLHLDKGRGDFFE